MLEYIVRLRDIFERADLALTFFEFTVALMFLYFAEAGVDVAVIETGLGGRLDSTNVVHPLLSVITPIGFDHMDRLGYTIAAIAGEKGGIIKEGVPVVIGARDPEARLVLTSIASQRHSAGLHGRSRVLVSLACAGPSARLSGSGATAGRTSNSRLAGPFQHENAAIALAAADAIRAEGWNLPEEAIRRGLREVSWPGRFDIVMRKPLVVLDCAHNELAIEALLESITVELGPEVKPRLIFGCLEDKQWERMAAMIGPRVQRRDDYPRGRQAAT